ncbi:hypothetical protein MIT9_P0375 [Methylomarinovum caldicuralii]|uniref:SPOR domain-containing protein n=1 Tax=Methylomarinovum caldicuralii TaxID=438856 RepID=A0AAU9C142_9GAMM|nr:SPOR domain-containing protein [Methylomarinovum caldicuralii]BCX80799.1 hypothetical protein MIT9_P0375 [Methylomarinovum caldicuralii]
MARRPPPRRRPVSRSRRPPRRERRVPWWLWGAVLVVLGGLGYFLYYLSREAPPAPAEKKPQATPRPKAAEGGKAKEPRFTFYTLLPEKEVIVPEGEVRTRKREEQLGRAAKGRYFVQAGSFRSLRDADRLKAQLALLGVESRVEPAQVRGATWYRVRLGPFTSMTEVERIRARLRRHRIDSVVQTAKR